MLLRLYESGKGNNMQQYQYIDVHCHPNLGGLREDQDAVIARMAAEGVLGIVVGVDLESSQEAVRLAHQHEHLYACVGLHPNYTGEEEFDISSFSALVKEKKVVGVGECGLDFFRQSTTSAGEEASEGWKEKQWEVFKQQVELATTHNKPLMVHCRPSKNSMDAYEEVADYLESKILDVGRQELRGLPRRQSRSLVWGNMHFFVGDLATAKRFWALGFTTSFTGVLTFTHDYDEVVREAPIDMILTETDAPYAAPVPYRGKKNQPIYVRYVLEAIARIRGESEESIENAVKNNAKRVFGIEFKPHIA